MSDKDYRPMEVVGVIGAIISLIKLLIETFGKKAALDEKETLK